jgi:hypothetical protein
MKRSLAFFALFVCAACATNESTSDRSVGYYDGGSGSSDRGGTDVSDAGPLPNDYGPCEGGSTMTAPRLVGAPVEKSGNTEVRIAWDAGGGKAYDLPATYFEKPKLVDGSIVVDTAPAGEREMLITLSGAPSTHAGKTETINLLFPDRRDFVKCGHPGMEDVYEVIIVITFSADGASATATFDEKVHLGDI